MAASHLPSPHQAPRAFLPLRRPPPTRAVAIPPPRGGARKKPRSRQGMIGTGVGRSRGSGMREAALVAKRPVFAHARPAQPSRPPSHLPGFQRSIPAESLHLSERRTARRSLKVIQGRLAAPAFANPSAARRSAPSNLGCVPPRGGASGLFASLLERKDQKPRCCTNLPPPTPLLLYRGSLAFPMPWAPAPIIHSQPRGRDKGM